jgi:hypothetical protein
MYPKEIAEREASCNLAVYPASVFRSVPSDDALPTENRICITSQLHLEGLQSIIDVDLPDPDGH